MSNKYSETLAIIGARPKHRTAIAELLRSADLPADDFVDHLPHFLVLVAETDPNTQIVLGAVGLQVCGADGLLRSLVVAPALRGTGWGRRLCAAAKARAEEMALTELWLLTTTAAPFFAAIGFTAQPRASAPDQVKQTAEFNHLCPASATCMRWQVAA